MKTIRLTIAGGMLGAMLLGSLNTVAAADPDLLQASPVQRRDYASDEFITMAPQPDMGATASPSNKPAMPALTPVEPPAVVDTPAVACEDEGFKLFRHPWLEDHRIDIRGWIDQGFTWNPDRPADRFNGPVGYNDRANEYQLNQIYMIMERVTQTDGCGLDVGGRVDFLYGTDRRFPVAYGLDSDWNNGERFYGLVMPQMYADVAINNLIIRGGHFLAPCGYESVMAPENFFYSHSYSFLYAQPTTLSGGQLIYKLNDRISVNMGLDTGWNDWDSPNGKVNYFGGFNWTSESEKTTVGFEVFLGNTTPLPAVESNRFLYTFVLTQKLGEKWRYVLENDYGRETNTLGTGVTADWLSFANYLFYDINDCWSFGARYEWMNDRDGAVVMRVGPPTAGPISSIYQDIAFGINYKPNKNLVVRSEVRWDWANNEEYAGDRPFDGGAKNQQFLWGTDVIFKF